MPRFNIYLYLIDYYWYNFFYLLLLCGKNGMNCV